MQALLCFLPDFVSGSWLVLVPSMEKGKFLLLLSQWLFFLWSLKRTLVVHQEDSCGSSRGIRGLSLVHSHSSLCCVSLSRVCWQVGQQAVWPCRRHSSHDSTSWWQWLLVQGLYLSHDALQYRQAESTGKFNECRGPIYFLFNIVRYSLQQILTSHLFLYIVPTV